jgi:hypothetical protein
MLTCPERCIDGSHIGIFSASPSTEAKESCGLSAVQIHAISLLHFLARDKDIRLLLAESEDHARWNFFRKLQISSTVAYRRTARIPPSVRAP